MNGNEGASPRSKVLLIDDSIDLLRGLRMALAQAGYLVEVLSRPENAMEVIDRVEPDIVVLDVMMPGTDGWTVLRSIRGNAATARLPVLMLTAKGSSDSKVAGFELGADDYLTKPFDIGELKSRIGALLRRSSFALSPEPPEHVFKAVHGSGEQILIPAADVYYIDGAHNYTYLHTHQERFLSRLTLGEAADQAPPEFLRVHRSYVVNLNRVAGGRWLPSSSYQLTLSDAAGTEITVSRKLVSEVQSRVGLK